MNERNNTQNAKRAPTRCPVCRGAVAAGAESFPFCSDRCRKVDLGRWLDEGYRISRPIEQRDLEEGVD